MKRIISLLLCLILIFGLGDWSVLAADGTDAEEAAPVTEAEETPEETQEETPDTETPDGETTDEEPSDGQDADTPDGETTDGQDTDTPDEETGDTQEEVPEPSASPEAAQTDAQEDEMTATEDLTKFLSGFAAAQAAAPEITPVNASAAQTATGKLTYLSDIPIYKMKTCTVGWGSYMRDKDVEGKSISLRIGGTVKEFTKGVAAHANACLIYDLGENHVYDKFKAYIGIDSDKGSNGNGVYFKFYGSTDNVTWTTIYAPTTVFKGNGNAESVELSVKDYRYFRVDVDCNGNNGYDHSVMAEARFVSDNYVASTDTVNIDILKDGAADKNEAYFAAKLTEITEDNLFTTENAELTLLQYTLVKNCGYDNLVKFLSTENSDERIAAFTWLFTNLDVLREYMNGGIPDGSNYIGALEALADLYTTYKTDLDDKTPLRKGETEGMVRGGLYRRMMLCMALVCANGHKGWMARAEISNPVNRYAYFKHNYVEGHMRDEIFENLGVDEMRWVLGNNISDAEIIWLNDYAWAHPRYGTQTSFPIIYSPHHHIKYQWYNYDKEQFYSEDNRTTYTSRYSLSGYEQYGLVYGKTSLGELTSQRLWQVFEDGAVCGNISRTGANIAASFGVPACEVGQPGHAAFCIMDKGKNNQMVWGIDNDISGWAESSNSRRMPADWGLDSDPTTTHPRACYVLLAQAALNDLPNYEKAEETLMLLPLAEDNTERERICRKALTYMAFHRDAWLELIQLKVKDSSVGAKDLADLARELCDSPMKFYPNAFRDLMQLIFNRMNEIAKNDTTGDAQIQLAQAQMLYNNALVRATQATEEDTAQPGPTKTLANKLLSGGTTVLATFSFDGNNAGKLVFREGFTSVRFQLSLDGGITWESHQISVSDGQRVIYELTNAEYESLTAENDIYIWLDGWSSSDGSPNKENAFSIDILASLTEANIKSLVEPNDYEDRLLGNLSSLEYSTDDGKTWNDLTSDTDLSGALTVKVHKKASGTTLQSADATFTFTDNHTNKARSYIPLSRLSVHDFSTEAVSQNQQAVKAIDGLEATIWHTQWGGGDSQRYITLKADKPTFFSGIDYLPRTDAGNGTITYCEVLVSVDGESWYTAAAASWSRNNSVKSITFTDVAYGQYIRIVGKSASGDFCSAREIRVFENKNFEGKTVAGARLTQEPTKLAYAAGEVISFDGAEVQCVYTDGSTHKVPLSMLTVSPEYAAGEGTQEVSLKYLNLPAMTFEIYVTPNTHTASKLTIAAPAAKTSYTLGSAPDTDGLVLLATEESSGTTWRVEAGEYSVSPATFTTKGTQKVTLTYQGITAEYEVSVIGKPTSIAITTAPEKTTYEIGEALNVDDMIVTVTYEDGTTEELKYASGRLRINGDGFSALPGEKSLTVTLTDDTSLTAELPVTVLTNLIDGDFRYDVEPSDTNPPQYTCYLSGYTNAASTAVSVPASVQCNGITYQVIGVRSGTFATASQVEYLSLPGTIQTLEETSLSALTNLKQLYLTGISDIDNLTIRDGALPEQTEESAGTIYMATPTMETALAEKLEAYQTTGDGEFHMKQGDLADSGAVASITVTAPEKTVYELGEAYDPAGFAVTAHLTSGIDLPLEDTLYTMDAVPTSTYGEHTVSVIYSGDTAKKDTFSVEVLKTAPTMLTNPKDGVYLSGEENLGTLSVTVKDGEKLKLRYQWYKSSTEKLSPGNDTAIPNATNSSYTPTDTGYYYAAVWRLDDNDVRSNPVYSMAAHIQVQDFAIKVVDTANKVTYFESLDEAMAKASSGSTVYLRMNIEVTRQTTVVSKTLTIAPAPEVTGSVTVKRADSYTGYLMEANNCNLTIKNVILDGGAVWTGDTDASLGRGTTNSGVGETASLLRMQNNTQLTLEGTTVQNCAVVPGGGAWGAALYVTSGADATIIGSTFKDNALGKNGCGVIQTDSDSSVITVSNSTFTGNYATVNGGAFCISAGKLDFQNGTIEHCKAGTSGGGIYVDSNATADFQGTLDTCSAPSGGGIYTKNGITLTNATVKNCSATGDGGGVYVYNGAVNITGGKLEGCTANNGGGIYSVNQAVTVNDAAFDKCSSAKSGGAIHSGNYPCHVTNVTFTKCSGYDGGAVYTGSGNISIVDSTFTSCSAGACGGCICTASGTVDASGNSSFTSCTAKLAGALWTNTGVIQVHDSVIMDSCKAIRNNNNGGMGGALSTLSGRIEILGGTIRGCTATDGGGAVRTETGSILVSGGTIESCQSSTNGGALLTTSGTITLSGGTIQGCTASGNGGAVSSNSGAVNLTGGTIDGGNTEAIGVTNAVLGGGIYTQSGAVTLSGGTIENCKVSDNGGGIYAESSSLTFRNGTIQNCTAAQNGGAICTNSGAVTMNGGVIDSCKASGATGGGGGICTVSGNNSNGSVTINGGTIKECTAVYIGGCVYSSSAGNITINGGTFRNNTAKYGGAIGTNSGATKVTYVKGGAYSGNKATENGGVIFIGGASTAHIEGGTYKNNTAEKGGSIYCAWNGGTHNFSGGLFLYDDGWIYKRKNPTVKITGGTYSTDLTESDGVDTVIYTVKTTQLLTRGSDTTTTAYTVVKLAADAAAEDHTELKNATILHTTNAQASEEKIIEALKKAASDENLVLDLTSENTTMALEVAEHHTEVNDQGEITKYVFDVTPKATVTYSITEEGKDPVTHTLSTTIPNEAIHEAVSFTLPVDSNVLSKTAMVYHKDTLLGILPIETDTENGSKHITVKSQSFSQFSYILLPETTCTDLQIAAISATLDDNITLNYKVLVPEGYENPYMVFSIYSDVKKGYVESIVRESTTSDSYRVFAFEGINPQRMQDTIKATLYASKDGVWYKIDKNEYSLKTYLESVLSNPANSAYYTLVSNLIAYGSAAQEYNNYEKNHLISSDFAENVNYKPVDYSSGAFDDVLSITKKEGGITFKSAALYLNNEVSVIIRFTLAEGTTIDNVKMTAGFTDQTAQNITEFKDEGNGVYSFMFKNIPATCFSSHILFKAYVNGAEDDTLEYNVNSYLKAYHTKNSKLGRLTKALFNYGRAAKNYVQSKSEN